MLIAIILAVVFGFVLIWLISKTQMTHVNSVMVNEEKKPSSKILVFLNTDMADIKNYRNFLKTALLLLDVSDVVILHQIANEKMAMELKEGLKQTHFVGNFSINKILFCTTDVGSWAIIRQISPSILLTDNHEIAGKSLKVLKDTIVHLIKPFLDQSHEVFQKYSLVGKMKFFSSLRESVDSVCVTK